MQITIKQLTDTNAYRYETVDAHKYAMYQGYDIYTDNDGWYYVQVNGEWNYFDNMNEARKFIRDIAK